GGRRGRARRQGPPDRRLPLLGARWAERQHDRLGGPGDPPPDRARRHLPGREVAAQEQGEGAQDPARAAPRAGAPGPAVRDRRQPEGDGRDGRALGEDPHLQLPAEPRDRSPREPDPPHARPRRRRGPRSAHRRARDAPAGRGAGGGGLMGAVARVATIADVLADAIARLAAAGVPEPRADAEVLLAYTLG